MLIETENTYNPNAMNFYFETQEQPQMYVSYADSDFNSADLTQIIQNLMGIKRVLLLKNLLFVEKEENADWALLTSQIMAELSDYDFNHLEKMTFSQNAQHKIIEALIDSQIRGFLIRDGGNLSVTDFQNGVLSVQLEGHCKGCVHASETLKNIVQSILKKYLPFVEDVKKGE